MKATTKKTTTATATAMYETAEKAVYICLRARHEKSGLQFLAELQNSQRQDRVARNSTAIAEEIHKHEEQHEEYRKEVDRYQALANRLTLTNEERTSAQTLADHYRTLAHNEQTTLADLYSAISTTYTDRADLTQTAVLQMLENEKNPAPITKTILASYGAESINELSGADRKKAQEQANFRAVVNAVGRAIGTLATPDALNSTTTIKTKATADEVAEWCRLYKATGKDTKIAVSVKRCRMSDCYDTMEYLETKTQKGWYKIRHYKTTAPYQYIDTYTENEDGETDIAYLKTYNPFISNCADLERIEELSQRANLTDRQRAFLEHFARRCRIEGDFKKCRDYAFSQIGVHTATNRTTFFNRLKKALATT